MSIKVKFTLRQMYIIEGGVAICKRRYFKADSYSSALLKVERMNMDFLKEMSGVGYVGWQISWNFDLFENSRYDVPFMTNFLIPDR